MSNRRLLSHFFARILVCKLCWRVTLGFRFVDLISPGLVIRATGISGSIACRDHGNCKSLPCLLTDTVQKGHTWDPMVRMGKTRTVFIGCSAPFAEAEPTLSGSFLVVLRGRLIKSALTARRYTAANMQEAHDLGCKASRVEYARVQKIHSGWHAHCACAYPKYAHQVCYCSYNRAVCHHTLL